MGDDAGFVGEGGGAWTTLSEGGSVVLALVGCHAVFEPGAVSDLLCNELGRGVEGLEGRGGGARDHGLRVGIGRRRGGRMGGWTGCLGVAERRRPGIMCDDCDVVSDGDNGEGLSGADDEGMAEAREGGGGGEKGGRRGKEAGNPARTAGTASATATTAAAAATGGGSNS